MDLVQMPQSMVDFLLDKTVQAMLDNTSQFTTLDVKNYFRNKYSNLYMTQDMVSNFMNNNYKNYNLEFTTNGQYRTYYISEPAFQLDNEDDNEDYYTSSSKGAILIKGMHYAHLLNALVKEFSLNTGITKPFLKSFFENLKTDNEELFNLLKEYTKR